MTEELERALGGYASIADFQTILIVAKDCARQAGLFEVATEIDRANDIITALTPKAEGVEERALSRDEHMTVVRLETVADASYFPAHKAAHDKDLRDAIAIIRKFTASPSRERVDRKAVLEEAAKVALRFETQDWASYDPRTIAAAIRALASPPADGGEG